MAREGFLKVHRKWEDWGLIALGVVTLLSPWLARETGNQTVLLNTTAVGIFIAGLGIIEMVSLHRLEEIAAFACGLWLIVSPSALGYAGTHGLANWHVVLGAAVLFLAVLELWQDWSLLDDDMKHRIK